MKIPPEKLRQWLAGAQLFERTAKAASSHGTAIDPPPLCFVSPSPKKVNQEAPLSSPFDEAEVRSTKVIRRRLPVYQNRPFIILKH